VPTIYTDGASLEYELIEGTARAASTMVFLHEGLGSLAQWKDFPRKLAAAAGCAGLVYSRRGHGQSALRAVPHTPQFMHHEAAATLPALLRELGITRPLLFGHSDGASIALLYAALEGSDNPPLGVVVEAPHVMVEARSIAGIEAAREAFLKTDLPQKLARYHRDAEHTFHGWNDIWLSPEFAAWNIEACLPRVACPVLAIQGYDDAYGTMAQIDIIAAQVTGEVALLKLAHCGHAPHREQEEKTLQATARFVRQLTL
jgi:pimeloyl-ACP methyl ester carboxylesterase